MQRRRIPTALAALVVASLLAACGGDDAVPAVQPTEEVATTDMAVAPEANTTADASSPPPRAEGAITLVTNEVCPESTTDGVVDLVVTGETTVADGTELEITYEVGIPAEGAPPNRTVTGVVEDGEVQFLVPLYDEAEQGRMQSVAVVGEDELVVDGDVLFDGERLVPDEDACT